MSVLDVEELLKEVSDDSPCGEDMEYDPQFGELERATQGSGEQQMGDSVIDAQEPDWKNVRKLSLGVMERSKDLRAAVYLTRAVLKMDGFLGLRDGLALLRGLIDRYWESFHPVLDPDDENDPTMRINTLTTLCDADTVLRDIRETAMVSSRVVGRFSYRDWLVASGEMGKPEGEDEPSIEMSTIEAAFLESEIEDMQAVHEALIQSADNVAAIEAAVTDQVGVSNAASFSSLESMLRNIERIVEEQLQRRGVGVEEEEDGEDDGSGGGPNGEAGGGKAKRLAGEVTSREDVLKALDKICEYYQKHEPSSPVPMLLNRAKRVATMSFIEILKELTPTGLEQAAALGGISPDGVDNE